MISNQNHFVFSEKKLVITKVIYFFCKFTLIIFFFIEIINFFCFMFSLNKKEQESTV